LIEKYKVKTDQQDIDLVEILTGHRDALGVDIPSAPITYEELMSYHLAFPPFFPNQKMFVSNDDFYVDVHTKYFNPDIANVESIIDRRRTWFEVEMEKKRERKINISYFEANGWSHLPAEGLASLTPFATDTTYMINYKNTGGEFANSGRHNDVAAYFLFVY
jgi:hypothetical protein